MQTNLIDSSKLQTSAITNLIASQELQFLLLKLIAEDDKKAIRVSAIEIFKFSSILEEYLVILDETSPENPKVHRLKELLKETKTPRLRLISKAKQNSDSEALAIFTGQLNIHLLEMIDLSKQILLDAKATINTLASKNTLEGEKIITEQSLVLIFVGLFVFGIAIYFSRQLIFSIESIRHAINDFSGGNLSPTMPENSVGEMKLITSDLNNAISIVRSVISSVHIEADKLISDSEKLSSNAKESSKIAQLNLLNSIEMSDRVNNVSASFSETQAMLDDISQQTNLSESNSIETEKSLQTSVAKFLKLKKELESLHHETSELVNASHSIQSITKSIGDISEQTNLLALNAAIEAARAGEQGRGFAVVADEVRSLAHRSGEATNEVAGIAENMQNKVENTVKQFKLAQELITESITSMESAQAFSEESQLTASSSKHMILSLHGTNTIQAGNLVESNKFAEDLADRIKSSNQQVNDVEEMSIRLGQSAKHLNSLVLEFKNFAKT